MPKAHELVRYDERDYRAVFNTGHMDANESMFFARQLEFIRPKALQTKRAPLSALALLPVSTDIPAGAKTHTYRMWDGVGLAKIIANYADDMPRVAVYGKEFTGKIRGVGVSYGWSYEDIRAAQMAGVNLNADQQMMAARAHDEELNRIAFFGDVEYDLPGFLTNPNIPFYVLPNDGTGPSRNLMTKTPDQIIRDLNAIVNSVKTTTKNIHQPNGLWLPQDVYTYLDTTPRGQYSEVTILGAFKKNQPNVSVLPVLELATAGAGNSRRIVCGEFNRENVRVEVPMSFMQHPPQLRNLEFMVPCESRTGGTVVPYPLAFTFADNA